MFVVMCRSWCNSESIYTPVFANASRETCERFIAKHGKTLYRFDELYIEEVDSELESEVK